MCVIVMILISNVGATESQDNMDEESIDSNQMLIHIDVWPKEILTGDCIYILFSVENKSQDILTIQPIEFFDNSLLRHDKSTPSIVKFPDYPSFNFIGNQAWGEFRCFASQVDPGIVTIQPGETLPVFTEIYAKTNGGIYFIQNEKGEYVQRTVGEEPLVLRVVNFAEKYASCVQLPWPTLNMNIRPRQEESVLVTRFLHNSSFGYIIRGGKFGNYGMVETASGIFTMQLFVPPIDLYVYHNDNKDKNLPTLSAWREFEAKLSPGTLRDEIRLGRIQVQYLDGDKEAALNELREWFAVMEPIQSMTLAASLCLPEGLEEESDKDELFKPVGTLKDEPEAHKHFMVMRREIDKIVAQYNILPKRKIRETPAY